MKKGLLIGLSSLEEKAKHMLRNKTWKMTESRTALCDLTRKIATSTVNIGNTIALFGKSCSHFLIAQ